MEFPRIAVAPVTERDSGGWAKNAIVRGGGRPVGVDEDPDGLVWLPAGSVDQLAEVLRIHPTVRWVQVPSAGVESLAAAGLLGSGRIWTCAKGAYAEPVAEHALLLALAALRGMRARMRATSWGERGGTCLWGERVTIIGGGGIAEALLRLLTPFRVQATAVRRQAIPVPGAAKTVGMDAIDDVLPGALVVFLALALTPQTAGVIGARQLDLMDERSWLVNVARGGHVDTDALTRALATGSIAGAALDVVDPEPLPADHPLWHEPRCIITPHTADTWEMTRPLLADRIAINTARWGRGEMLDGVIDPAAGY